MARIRTLSRSSTKPVSLRQGGAPGQHRSASATLELRCGWTAWCELTRAVPSMEYSQTSKGCQRHCQAYKGGARPPCYLTALRESRRSTPGRTKRDFEICCAVTSSKRYPPLRMHLRLARLPRGGGGESGRSLQLFYPGVLAVSTREDTQKLVSIARGAL